MIEEHLSLKKAKKWISYYNRFHWDEWCFYCKQDGQRRGCSRCNKSFHVECEKKVKKKFQEIEVEALDEQDQLLCPYCQYSSICTVCWKVVNDQYLNVLKFKCTICCNLVHQQCCNYDQYIQTNSKSNYIPLVCFECFLLCGIQHIQQRKIVDGNTFFLSEPYFCSHIHSGWITLQQLTIITEHSKKSKRNHGIITQIKRNQVKQIQQVLMIKPEIKNYINWPQYIQQNLESQNAMKVYVKWKGQSADKSSWQDQFTLRQFNLFKSPQIQLYILRKWCNTGILTVEEFRIKALKLFPTMLMDSNIVSQQFLKTLFEFKFGYCLNNINPFIFLLSSLLQSPKYLTFKKLLPINRILFLTQTPKFWTRILKQYFPFLQISVSVYNSQTFNLENDIAFYSKQQLPMFDVLLISYQKNKTTKIIQQLDFDLIISDKPSYEDINKIFAVYPNILKLSLYERNDQNKTSKIFKKHFGDTYSNKVVISKSSIISNSQINNNNNMFLNKALCKDNNDKQVSYEEISKNMKQNYLVDSLNLLQRLHFLRFVLQFGLDYSNFQEMYHCLTQFEPHKQIFIKQESIFKFTKIHLDQFLSGLVSNKHSQYLYEQWKCSDISRRIAALTIIRRAYNFYKNQPLNLPISLTFPFADKGEIRLYSFNWKHKDDIRLMQLIIKYGYNNFKLMCQNFCQNQQQDGYEYLRQTIWPDLRQDDNWKRYIQFCLKVRCNILLESKQLAEVMKQL